ncbi:hypothetical protein ABIB80_004158 [Bradyrhizobium sp. i1.15.2]|uniref:hypothetical protein n=1 Tax=Bradyrhizobium sp. i1.15.2 TaxID=3156362 RepID=UPI0033943BD9
MHEAISQPRRNLAETEGVEGAGIERRLTRGDDAGGEIENGHGRSRAETTFIVHL